MRSARPSPPKSMKKTGRQLTPKAPSKVNSAAVIIRVNLGRDRAEQLLRDSTELKTQRRKKFS